MFRCNGRRNKPHSALVKQQNAPFTKAPRSKEWPGVLRRDCNYDLRRGSVVSLIAQCPVTLKIFTWPCWHFTDGSKLALDSDAAPGVKLLEDFCLYLSVSNNSVFAQQQLSLRASWHNHCWVIRPLHQSDKTGPTQPWKHHSVSPSFDSPSIAFYMLKNYPPGNKRICIPHLSLSSWQSNATPQPKISERWGEKTPVDFAPFYGKI